MTGKAKAAVIGSGNIGTDLMIKMIRLSQRLEIAAMVGIDPASDGLARARRLGVPTTADGVDGLIGLPGFEEIGIVFDATSARAHEANARALAPYGTRMIDLTPAALGPFVVPAVNLEEHADAPDLNMVTCGGQATIPIVAAVARVMPVPYAEIVASIASRSAGPGTRWPPSRGWRRPCATTAVRCGPGRWCCRARSGRWCRSPLATPSTPTSAGSGRSAPCSPAVRHDRQG